MKRTTVYFGGIQITGLVTEKRIPEIVAGMVIQLAREIGAHVPPIAIAEPLSSVYYVYVDPMVLPKFPIKAYAIGEYDENEETVVGITDSEKCIEEIGKVLLETGIPPIGIIHAMHMMIPPIPEIEEVITLCKV